MNGTTGLSVKTGLKGGRLASNHNGSAGLKVQAGLKGGKLASNHNGAIRR